MKLIHLDLFSGIGGFALALDNVYGKENVEHIFCDNEPFAQEVLKKHWPSSKIYGDIRSLTYAEFARARMEAQNATDEGRQDTDSRKPKVVRQGNGSSNAEGVTAGAFILTGGFPCQPFSQAGRRRGTDDNRYLWPEMLRVIQEFHPRWVIGENVGGLVTWNDGLVLEQVHLDLEAEGYEVQAFIIPAVSVNAPHRRDRVWFVAHRRSEESSRLSSSRKQKVRTARASSWNEPWLEVATRLCRVDDGIPRRLDRNPRLKALGNAIVPQVAEEIMRAIYKVTPPRRTA